MQKIQDKKVNSLTEIKQVYESGEYFTDAYDWYCDRFLSPYSERVFLFFLSLLSLVIMVIVVLTIIGLFPLKETFPVLVKQQDSLLKVPVIKKLKPENIDYSSNESLARYLGIEYVKSLFGNDFSSGDLNTLQNKLDKLKGMSNRPTLEKSRAYLNELFKNGVQQDINISTVKFVDKSKEIYSSDRESYVMEFICTIRTLEGRDIKNEEKKRILLSFRLNNISYSTRNNKFDPIRFIVNDFVIKDR